MNFAKYGIINARKYPEKEYLVEVRPPRKRRKLTWKEFNEETNRVANYLQNEVGVRKGDFVLHLQMNSLEWIVTFHAILRVGATVVPLSFRFASADIKYAALACNPSAFIFDERFIPKIEPIREEMGSIRSFICIGDQVPQNMVSYDSMIKNGDLSEILVSVDKNDPAELMFTSGTTGPPKPVCQAHDTLYQIGISIALTYSLGHETVYLNPHPFYHSGSFFLNLAPYLAGGTTLILPDSSDPKFLLEATCDEKVTDGQVAVPAMADLVNAIKKGEIDITNYDLSHLKNMHVGAQPVPSSLFRDIKQIFPFDTGNMYGITEGGGAGSTHLFDADILTRPGSIGRPTFNIETRIVDDSGNDVGVGKVGELLLRGPRIMKEYYKNPEMTKEAIRDGWLYTGDLVRADDDGYIYIADRKKDLIIRGGENIFPAEIEDVLRHHPKVADAAVIGYPHERLVEISMAIVQLFPGDTMEKEEVIDFCAKQGLAKYKWPEKIVFNDVIRNATGKIDKPLLRIKYIGKKEVAVGE